MTFAEKYFSADYATARSKFAAAARRRGLEVRSIAHPERGAQGEDLAMDVALLGPRDAASLLVLTSGTHGVEGFSGSAAQVALLDDEILLRMLETGGVAALLVHAVNPYGFSHSRRVNEGNVDVNRNFRDFSVAENFNSAYARLHGYLVPAQWPPTADNQIGLAALEAEMGARSFRAAHSSGQNSHPRGVFFCGTKPTWSNLAVRSLLREFGSNRERIGWVDLHSGLGPYGHGEKIYSGVNLPQDILRARSWFGADVVSHYVGNEKTGRVQGTMVKAVYDECPRSEATCIVLEFGTLPFERVVEAIRGDNWATYTADVRMSVRDDIKRAIRNAFYVEADDWKGMVLGQSRTAILQAVTGLSSPRVL